MSKPIKIIQENSPWYSEGLRFKCTECGQCCTGAPGYVWVSDEEIQIISKHLGLTEQEFGKRFLRYVYHPPVENSHSDLARHSQIEASRSERGSPSPCGKGDEEDRFGKAAASQNENFKLEDGINGRYALLEKPSSYDCIFLQNKKCQIYQIRPTQCRTFPWWAQNLASPESWKEAASYCEGISDEAPLVSLNEIQQQLDQKI